MAYSIFPRRTLLRVLMLACGMLTVAAFAEEGATAAKLAKYEQLKLPELVRRAHVNDAWAQFELGSRFNYGRNAPKNNAEALNWLRRAAQNGQHDAQRLLAVKLYNGYDVPVDQDEALLWAQRLAESGDVPGQMMLANMYAGGEGSPRDLVRAYMWYDIAATVAQQGNGDLALQQNAVDMRDKTAALLLPDEEIKAQQLASGWWLRKQGVSLAPKAKSKGKTAGKKPVPKKPGSKAAAPAKPKVPEKPVMPGSPAAPLNPEVKKP